MASAFLTYQVKYPYGGNWGKMNIVLKYLKGTRHMKLTLLVESVSMIRWWVYASYNAHDECKGHTGAMMSIGKRDVLSRTMKQKLNMRSSTEGELLGADDIIGYVLWGKYFI